MIERDVTFPSGDLTLSGTLTLPDTGAPCPVVLLIAGSGQVDRDENHKKMRINVFRDVTDHLAGLGIGTFRYDKRGVGESEGDYWGTGLHDNAADALSALTYLKNQSDVDTKAIFLLGHSEGAVISTMLASEGADVAGIILIGGSARPGEEVLKWQALQVVKGMKGLSKWIIKLFRIDVAKSQQKQLDKIKRSTKETYRVQMIAKLNAKWMREFLAYNPADDLPQITVPILAITGEKDIQTDPEDLRIMAKLVKSEFEYHTVPNVTHILRIEDGEPSLSHYKKQVKQPTAPVVLELISDWLKKQISSSTSGD
jgi:pimeloyl-ACP methyl ester carboxylesterase